MYQHPTLFDNDSQGGGSRPSPVNAMMPLGTNTLEARGYQDEAISSIDECLRDNDSTLLILPTGAGKTVVFSLASRRWAEAGMRTLILAHREELITQAANVIERVGITPGIEKAELTARSFFDPTVVVASVQTLTQPRRLAKWPRRYFDRIVVDEAHHSTAKTYQRIINHFGNAKLIGVTATPDRADDERLDSVFSSIAYELTIFDLMTAPHPGPYLCPLRVNRCAEPIDLRGLKTTGEDYSAADLEAVIGPIVEMLANAIRERIDERQTIVFTPDVGSSQAMASALNSLGIAAKFTHGGDPDRAAKVAEYKAGKFQVFCNCMVFTEGADFPATSAIVPLRPTQSRALYSQMIGRGTRLHPGKKDCLIVDFAWLTSNHDLVRPGDLFDSTHVDDDTRAALNAIIDKGGNASEGVDMFDAIAQARTEAKRRRDLRVQAEIRATNIKWVSYDPAAVADCIGSPIRAPRSAKHRIASERQAAALDRFGVKQADGLSARNASNLLETLITRSRAGLATHKQVAHLIKNGVEPEIARALSIKEASAELDRIFNKR